MNKIIAERYELIDEKDVLDGRLDLLLVKEEWQMFI